VNVNQLAELRRIVAGETTYPGKVVDIENGGAVVATSKGLQKTRTFAEIGSRVVMQDGEILRVSKTEKLPQYTV
jgi:hypothetical protein